MSEKTTVSETKYEINDMLNRYGLSDSFNKCIIKYGEKMKLVQGAEAEEFIISKLDDLVKTVDDNKTNKTTDDELKTLISGWIAEQDRIVDQMVKKITKKAFDQNDVKTMNAAKNIDFTSLLKTFELEDEFYGTLVKICNKLGYHQDDEGNEFIFSRFTDCDKYLTDNSTKIPTPEPEFRDLVVGWIAKQNETLESLEEYERKEDLSFIQQVMNKYVGNGHEQEFGYAEEVEVILIHGTYTLISAGKNPKRDEDANKPPEYFAQRHELLKKELIKVGVVFTQVIEKHDGVEDPYLIMAHELSRKEAFDGGSAFKQDSIRYVTEGKNQLIYTMDSCKDDGTPIPKGSYYEGESFKDSKTDIDNYIEIEMKNGIRVKYTLLFDWDNLKHPVSGASGVHKRQDKQANDSDMIIDGKVYNVVNLLTPDKESQEERAKMLRGTSIGVSVKVIKIGDKWAICWRAGTKMDEFNARVPSLCSALKQTIWAPMSHMAIPTLLGAADDLILEISNYNGPEKEQKEALLKQITDSRKGFHRETDSSKWIYAHCDVCDWRIVHTDSADVDERKKKHMLTHQR